MALIKCKECGTKISEKARFCPNCGRPISSSPTDVVARAFGIIIGIILVYYGLKLM